MLHLVLFQPDIPNNTGNIGRLSAIAGARLHLIHPLGFEISDKHLRRAGMDYWHSLDVVEHQNWDDFLKSPKGPKRLWLFTTHATKSFWDVRYAQEDGLVFGKETAGAPQWLHDQIGAEQSLRVDHMQSGLRSLNLATCAAVATYEALRQFQV